MQNILEQITIYARGMWRYRWYAMTIAWLIVLAGWLILSRVPNKYTATAQIHADTVTILKPLMKGLIVDEDNAGAQLGLMTQLLLSRPYLERVAINVGLDRPELTPQQFDNVLLQLKENISISGSRTNPRANYLDLYTISCTGTNSEVARKIVQTLIDNFVEDTLKQAKQDTEAAKRFLGGEIKDYENKLTEAENRLGEFKRQHADELPEQGGGYYQRLQATRSAIEDIDLQIREAESQRKELLQQLEGTPAGQRAVSIQGAPVLTPAESRLMALQTQLDQLLLKYTEEYPDVIATKRMIAELEKQKEMEIKELASGTSSSSAAVPNPVHQQLKLKLREVETNLAALKSRRDEYARRIQLLERQRDSMISVETELQRLNRDYEINKDKYQALVARREAMQISENVQQTDESVKFSIVDIPRVQVGATIKKRIILVTGVLGAGLAGGLLVAFAFSQMRPVIFSRRTLSELTGIPVFGTISQARTLSMKRRQRLDLLGLAMAVLLMLVSYGFVLFLQLRNIG